MGCTESCHASPSSIFLETIDPENDRLQHAFSAVPPVRVLSRRDMRGGSLDSNDLRRAQSTSSLQSDVIRRRISQMKTSAVDDIRVSIERASRTGNVADVSLEERLSSFGMQIYRVESDGNCQFRSLAFNLFGSQDHHAITRKSIVAHMEKHREFFSMFFDGPREFETFIEEMALNATWGDELTLRAAVEVYGCVAHVITSEAANWYLTYEPEKGKISVDTEIAKVPEGMALPPAGKHIFLAYASPVHYDSIIAKNS